MFEDLRADDEIKSAAIEREDERVGIQIAYRVARRGEVDPGPTPLSHLPQVIE
jgi:hypothetical protein